MSRGNEGTYLSKGNPCKEFTELFNSNVVEIRSGCIAIITRDCDGNGIEAYGQPLKFCPYCGAKIVAEYDNDNGYWNWWHE